MQDKAFFDTNVILYLYSKDEIEKQSKSLKIVNNYAQAIISTQVINELLNVLSKKMKLEWDEINKVLVEIMKSFTIHVVNISDIQSACKISEHYLYSYFDSLIIASTLSTNAKILFSEDLQHRQIIENRLEIINPYL